MTQTRPLPPPGAGADACVFVADFDVEVLVDAVFDAEAGASEWAVDALAVGVPLDGFAAFLLRLDDFVDEAGEEAGAALDEPAVDFEALAVEPLAPVVDFFERVFFVELDEAVPDPEDDLEEAEESPVVAAEAVLVFFAFEDFLVVFAGVVDDVVVELEAASLEDCAGRAAGARRTQANQKAAAARIRLGL
ncbi:MAG: hypothetical protein WBF14_02595 [Candidatus Acidiferrales bacterium]